MPTRYFQQHDRPPKLFNPIWKTPDPAKANRQRHDNPISLQQTMTDPLLAQFGKQNSKFPAFCSPDTCRSVIGAIKHSIELKSGWHTAVITFKLDCNGKPIELGEYKVSSHGEVKP